MSKIDFFILSDSLGNTAEENAMAAISQYEDLDYNIKKFSHIVSKAVLIDVLNEIENPERTIIFFSLVDKELREYLDGHANEKDILRVDVLTKGLETIGKLTDIEPSGKTGALRRLDENYFQRVRAIEFAVKYDDGKDPRGVLEADLTIIGVSRTSKTPLSMYLANKNYRVANIPLVPETELPEELFQIPSRKVIGLTNSPENLNLIRKERLKALGLPQGSSYCDLSRILEEITYAEEIMKKIGCPVIDVSNRAIEETAEIIISYIKRSTSSII